MFLDTVAQPLTVLGNSWIPYTIPFLLQDNPYLYPMVEILQVRG